MISEAVRIASEQGFDLEALRQEKWYQTNRLYCTYSQFKCFKALNRCVRSIALWLQDNVWIPSGRTAKPLDQQRGIYGELLLALMCDKRQQMLEQWFPTLAIRPDRRAKVTGSNAN